MGLVKQKDTNALVALGAVGAILLLVATNKYVPTLTALASPPRPLSHREWP
jgi:hypothetical protein